MAYYGNLALRPERVEEEKVQPIRKTQNSKAPRRRSIPMGEKLIYLFTVGLVVLVAGFIIFRYAEIYQINGQIQKTNKSYEQLMEQNKELQREGERLSDPNEIIKKATGKLGMVPISGGITASKVDQNAVAMKP